MRVQLTLALALTLGCDDPAVGEAVEAALVHGIAAAQVECDETVSGPPWGSSRIIYSGSRLLDGSMIIRAQAVGSFDSTVFCARSDACSDTGEIVLQFAANYPLTVRVSAGSGEFRVHCPECSDPADTPDVFNISTECTGFNLESFE